MKKIKIFLASSAELKADRERFETEIYRKCKIWIDSGIFLHLDIWEDSSAQMSGTRSQDEYNKLIREGDLFVLLAHTKVGDYTHEEFITAQGQFQAERKPFIFTYFKQVPFGFDVSTPEAKSLREFQEKLKKLGHFYCHYQDTNDLWNQFNKELERLDRDGFARNLRSVDQVTSTSVHGDMVGRDKIGKQINMGDHSTYNETNNG
jgi:hypothetical protein